MSLGEERRSPPGLAGVWNSSNPPPHWPVPASPGQGESGALTQTLLFPPGLGVGQVARVAAPQRRPYLLNAWLDKPGGPPSPPPGGHHADWH